MRVVFAILIGDHDPLVVGVGPVQVTGCIINGQILNAMSHTLEQIWIGFILHHVMLANFLSSIIRPINATVFVIGGKGPVL